MSLVNICESILFARLYLCVYTCRSSALLQFFFPSSIGSCFHERNMTLSVNQRLVVPRFALFHGLQIFRRYERKWNPAYSCTIVTLQLPTHGVEY